MSNSPETDAAIKTQAQWKRPFVSCTMDGVTWDGPIADLCRRLEHERDELRAIVEQRLVAGATIHQNANDLMRRNERLESERDELIGVIKSLRKNAREDADRIKQLEQALYFGSNINNECE